MRRPECGGRALGIASVREYEEKTLRAAREREAELLQLRQQHSKLNAQLLFERRKDLPAAADKLRDLYGVTLAKPPSATAATASFRGNDGNDWMKMPSPKKGAQSAADEEGSNNE